MLPMWKISAASYLTNRVDIADATIVGQVLDWQVPERHPVLQDDLGHRTDSIEAGEATLASQNSR